MTSAAPSATSTTIAETVLVVEDDILIRLVIAQYLRECGYKVIEAANGEEAVIVLMQAELKIDVVFSTVQMPGAMDGFALARWTRQNRKGVDVILEIGRASCRERVKLWGDSE